MTDSIVRIVDEAVYNAFREMRPSLIEAVASAVALGLTPAEIESDLAERGNNAEMVRYVRCIAEHLRRKRRT